MRSIVPFAWRRLTSASVLLYRVNDAGQIVVQGNTPPFQPKINPKCYDWRMCTGGDEWVLRTVGAPSSMTGIKAKFGSLTLAASNKHSVDERLILTTIMCESGGSTDLAATSRAEPGYPDYPTFNQATVHSICSPARDAEDIASTGGMKASYGLMQTLLGVAHASAPQLFSSADPSTWRDIITVPANGIECGTADMGAGRLKTVNTDPVATRFTYGAGHIYAPSLARMNPWGAVFSDESMITRFLAYWNDLVEVETPGAGTALVSFGVFAFAVLMHAAHCIQG